MSDKLKRDALKALTILEIKKRLDDDVFVDKLLEFMVHVNMDEQRDAYDRAMQEGLFTVEEWRRVFRKYNQPNGSNAFLAYVAAMYRHNGDADAKFLVLRSDPLYGDRVKIEKRFKMKIVTMDELFGGK